MAYNELELIFLIACRDIVGDRDKKEIIKELLPENKNGIDLTKAYDHFSDMLEVYMDGNTHNYIQDPEDMFYILMTLPEDSNALKLMRVTRDQYIRQIMTDATENVGDLDNVLILAKEIESFFCNMKPETNPDNIELLWQASLAAREKLGL